VRKLAIALFALAGCIDEFSGSELQIDFSREMPVQASAFRAQSPDELPNNIHFTLYAFDEAMVDGGMTVGYLFAIQQFEVHRVVDLDSPCYIDVGEHVPIEGLHVSQYANEIMKKYGFTDVSMPPAGATEEQKIAVATALERQKNVLGMASSGSPPDSYGGPKAITSVSTGGYPAIAADCSDPSGIPPPDCVEPDANQRRLEQGQAAWEQDPDLFEGTDRVLTRPLNGTTYGMAVGVNPINMGPIGGSAFFVDETLTDFDGYAIYWQYDDADGDGEPDYPASVPADERNEFGTLFLSGRPETPTRGVIHVHMTSLVAPAVSAELAIFADIDEDSVHF
jgi:hypothetical protein